jgi:hypothetical protein
LRREGLAFAPAPPLLDDALCHYKPPLTQNFVLVGVLQDLLNASIVSRCNADRCAHGYKSGLHGPEQSVLALFRANDVPNGPRVNAPQEYLSTLN